SWRSMSRRHSWRGLPAPNQRADSTPTIIITTANRIAAVEATVMAGVPIMVGMGRNNTNNRHNSNSRTTHSNKGRSIPLSDKDMSTTAATTGITTAIRAASIFPGAPAVGDAAKPRHPS
ncbi:hypothetical protein BGZ50_005204, partial [Haplosporangium sp. Z 11]